MQATKETAKVTVTNLDISFLNLVGLFVKSAFAMIPAMIIISIVIFALTGVFTAMFAPIQ